MYLQCIFCSNLPAVKTDTDCKTGSTVEVEGNRDTLEPVPRLHSSP